MQIVLLRRGHQVCEKMFESGSCSKYQTRIVVLIVLNVFIFAGHEDSFLTKFWFLVLKVQIGELFKDILICFFPSTHLVPLPDLILAEIWPGLLLPWLDQQI